MVWTFELGKNTHCRSGFQVVAEDIYRNSEISSVKGIRSVPALRAKLSSFRHHGMKVAQCKENSFELGLTGAHFQGVLQNRKVTHRVDIS